MFIKESTWKKKGGFALAVLVILIQEIFVILVTREGFLKFMSKNLLGFVSVGIL